MKKRRMYLAAVICLSVISLNVVSANVLSVNPTSANAVAVNPASTDAEAEVHETGAEKAKAISTEKTESKGGAEENGAEDDGTGFRTYALDSFNGDILEADLEDYSFTEDRVSFTYQDKLFNFSLEKYEMKDTRVDGVEYYIGNEGDLDCYVVVYEGSVCIKVTDMAQSVAGRQKDTLNNFTVVAFDNEDGNIEEISDMMKTMEEKSTK
ncbi:hypothetical protein NXH76_25870 [Blautia schinkii]|nr:hypothetical protein [Blautia schinkii]